MERERQARWDAAHLCTASTRLSMDKYLVIRALCALGGTTVYALIKDLLDAWLDAVAGDDAEAQVEGQMEIR